MSRQNSIAICPENARELWGFLQRYNWRFSAVNYFPQKNPWFSDIFRGCRNVILAWNRLILHWYWSHKYFWNSIHSLLLHCVKMPVFGVILVCISAYSGRMRESTDQNSVRMRENMNEDNSEYRHFLGSACSEDLHDLNVCCRPYGAIL